MTDDDKQRAEEEFRLKLRRQQQELVRGYIMMLIGVGLIVFSFVPPVKPAALTLGGAMIGFNPLLRGITTSDQTFEQSSHK